MKASKLHVACSVAAAALLVTVSASYGAGSESGSQSFESTAGKTYAATQSEGGTSLDAIRALPTTVAPIPVAFKADHLKVLAGRPRVVVPNYGVAYLLSGKVRASSAGSGMAIVHRAVKYDTALVGVDEALMKTLANEAHADLITRLKAAGIDVVPPEELKANAEFASLSGQPGNRNEGKGVIDSRATKSWVVFGADAAPLAKGMNLTPGFSSELGKMESIAADLDAVVVQPLLGIDYIALESSGNKTFGRKATASASLQFSVHSLSRVSFGYKPKRMPGTGPWGSLTTAGSSSPEPFAVLSEVGDKSDNVAVQNAFALAGLGSLFRTSKVLAAETVPERYAGLVRAAYQGFNQSLVDQIVAAHAKK